MDLQTYQEAGNILEFKRKFESTAKEVVKVGEVAIVFELGELVIDIDYTDETSKYMAIRNLQIRKVKLAKKFASDLAALYNEAAQEMHEEFLNL